MINLEEPVEDRMEVKTLGASTLSCPRDRKLNNSTCIACNQGGLGLLAPSERGSCFQEVFCQQYMI